MPSFFDAPILNSPYEYPSRHWELDEHGQPTDRILDQRRRVSFITPVPRPKKRKASPKQAEMVFDEGKGLSTEKQQYDPTGIINEVRQHVDAWRQLAPGLLHLLRLLDGGVGSWRLYDASVEGPPRIVAFGAVGRPAIAVDADRLAAVRRQMEETR